jgi:GNAT superfamily N-acetyltransferase
MKIKVRKATKEDMPRIFEIEKRSYPPQLQATREVLMERNEIFGIWVAEIEGKIAGFYTCIPIKLGWQKPNIEKILKNRKPRYRAWFREYQAGIKPDTLWVTSTAVERKYQGKGIGSTMIKHSITMAKRLGLGHRASALRCQYARYNKATGKSIENYIKEVIAGKQKDRFLAPYLKQKFELRTPLPNYEPHKGSNNFNIFAYKRVQIKR